jgi:FtsH-binding integral membrane protein
MADAEEKRETGASLIFIGLALWVVSLLVVFFLPSGMKMGRETTFFGIIAVLFGLGLVLMIAGYLKRQKAGTEE